MGICLGTQVKAGRSLNTGLSSKHVNADAKDLSSQSTKIENDHSRTSNKVSAVSMQSENLQPSNLKNFNLQELQAATRNFRQDSVLGGGFKGWIDEHSLSAAKPGTGIVVAVKKLNQDCIQGHKEWLARHGIIPQEAGLEAEINYLGQLSHPHLVKLIGYCLEDENRFLVYEFMSRGSLENHLFLRGSYFQPLSWGLRLKVALGAAKGLAFLHSVEARVIYRNFKTSNVLLDSNYNAKLSDLGLAKEGPIDDNCRVSNRGIGTYGYAAPEYLATGHLSAKSDVFSFGVVLLEILSGKRVVDKNRPPGQQNLVEWAKPYLSNKRKIMRVFDNRLEGQYSLDEAYKVASLSLRCLSTESKLRPNMDEVVSNLEQLHVTLENNGGSRNQSRRVSADDVVHGRNGGSYP